MRVFCFHMQAHALLLFMGGFYVGSGFTCIAVAVSRGAMSEEEESEPEESVVSGWQRLFDEVHTVQESIMRHYR